jgi:hypothetical protein
MEVSTTFTSSHSGQSGRRREQEAGGEVGRIGLGWFQVRRGQSGTQVTTSPVLLNRRLHASSVACQICFHHGVSIRASYRAVRPVLVRLPGSVSAELSARIADSRW